MGRSGRGICLLCALFVLFTAVSLPMPAISADFAAPALEVVYHTEDMGSRSFYLDLVPETNGTWLWLSVPFDTDLRALEVWYVPREEGTLSIDFPMALGGWSISSQPAIVNFTDSENPYPYAVYENKTGAPLWFGWLTVSHAEKPFDLPMTPMIMPVPPAEPPTPPPTEPPTVPPTEPPTLPPTEPPTVPPTEPPTLPPTEPPTFPPILPLTEPPTATPSRVPPTLLPTWGPPIRQPHPLPPPYPSMPRPVQTRSPQIGYAAVSANNVNVRKVPQGTVLARVQRGDVVYVKGQAIDANGMVWHDANILDSSVAGYIRGDLIRFMTAQEIYEYLNQPKYTPSPVPVAGYARVVWQSAALRGSPSSSGISLRTLKAGNVAYIMGDSFDRYGTRWYAARVDGISGYLLAATVTMMTPQETAEYLAISNPGYSYAVVRMNNVNFRKTPGGETIRRVHSGTLARFLSGSTWAGGYYWYRVRIDETIGYLREDMVELVQIAATPSPRPTARPTPRPAITPWWTPTPKPTPLPTITIKATKAPAPAPAPPLPTAQPMGMLDRLRAAVDSARYTDYARAKAQAKSYAIRDFDCDNLMELLLVSVTQNPNNTYTLALDIYKLKDGEIKQVDSRAFDGILASGTEAQVVLLKQAGREFIYFAERNSLLKTTLRGQALTLTDSGFAGLTLDSGPQDFKLLLAAGADSLGAVALEDHSGLRTEGGEMPADTREAASAIFSVLIRLMQGILQGNG